MSGGFGVQTSVAPARGEELEQIMSMCEGSAMIFPARFLALEVYRSWMVGRSAPIIISAVLTVHYSLFLSSLVADPNQTVMDERTDSMTAV